MEQVGIRELISEKAVDKRIEEMGAQISRDFAGKEVHLIAILKGGVFFACELAKRITVPVTIDFMSVSRRFQRIFRNRKNRKGPG